IYLVHRRDKFTAAPESVRQLRHIAETDKIELVTGYQLNALDGNNGELQSVIVKDLQNNTRKLDANILLPFFGLKQDLGSLANWGLSVKLHHIEVDSSYYQTNIEGIYAIGDIAHYGGKLKLILTGFAEAASSLHHAYSRVFDGKALHFEYSTTKYGEKK
ncbi:MAG: NAD(P)/FAD-dependent oxidoreductase, partial [Rickettsia aeschlimannii]